jgi:hypothetical protein
MGAGICFQVAQAFESLDSAFSRSDWLVGVAPRNWVSIGGKSPMRSLSVVGVWVFEFLANHRLLGNCYLVNNRAWLRYTRQVNSLSGLAGF